MNQLVIDAGNSRVKAAVYKSGRSIHLEVISELTVEWLESLAGTFHPGSTIISSVAGINDQVMAKIKTLPCNILLSHQTPIPFKNRYETPATLGHDRLANAAGAISFFPQKNSLIIDAGTCLKFDFINATLEYLGGGISPGLHMRYKAVHHYTGQLPLLEPVTETDLIGNSTANSIHSGIFNGMLAEITGIIGLYENKFDNVQLILTGGDARFFLNHLKKSIFATPELTLKGLQTILQYNYPDDPS